MFPLLWIALGANRYYTKLHPWYTHIRAPILAHKRFPGQPLLPAGHPDDGIYSIHSWIPTVPLIPAEIKLIYIPLQVLN